MESIIAPPFQAAFYYMAGCVLSKNKTRPRNFLKIAKNDPGCSLMLFNPRPSLRTLRTLRLPGRALIPPHRLVMGFYCQEETKGTTKKNPENQTKTKL